MNYLIRTPSRSFARAAKRRMAECAHARRNQDFGRCFGAARENSGPSCRDNRLRQSELFALKWTDVDFIHGTMNVTRSITYGVVGRGKTESSQAPVRIHKVVADLLARWKQNRSYHAPDDWVFASEHYRGRKSYWGQVILRQFIRPKAQELGIEKRFGWHTFRYTYSTLLRSVGTEFKVMQELMRHSSLRSTMDVYTQAVTSQARSSMRGVVTSLSTWDAG